MLYLRSPVLLHLVVGSLFPLTNVSPLQTPGNCHFTFWFSEFVFFEILHLSEITWYLSMLSFFSLSVVFSRFIYVVTSGMISFLFMAEQHSVCMCILNSVYVHFLYPFSVAGHWGSVYILIIVSNECKCADNSEISFQFTLNMYWEMELLNHIAVLILFFWGTSVVLSIEAISVVLKCSFFSMSLLIFAISCLFYNKHPNRCENIYHWNTYISLEHM